MASFVFTALEMGWGVSRKLATFRKMTNRGVSQIFECGQFHENGPQNTKN